MSEKLSLTRVFFDSDAVIAGSASLNGAAFILLQLSELGLIKGMISQQVIDECHRNIQNKLHSALPVFEKIISNSLLIVETPTHRVMKNYSHMAHQKDVPILAAAVNCKSDVLITFNTKDFFPDSEIPIRIVEPGDFLKSVRHQLNQLADL